MDLTLKLTSFLWVEIGFLVGLMVSISAFVKYVHNNVHSLFNDIKNVIL